MFTKHSEEFKASIGLLTSVAPRSYCKLGCRAEDFGYVHRNCHVKFLLQSLPRQGNNLSYPYYTHDSYCGL